MTRRRGCCDIPHLPTGPQGPPGPQGPQGDAGVGASPITLNYIAQGTGPSITDGTWSFSGVDIIPNIAGSSIGSPSNYIDTIHLGSVLNYHNGSLIFEEGGVERARFQNQNFGLGTDTPSSLLTLRTSLSDDDITFVDATDVPVLILGISGTDGGHLKFTDASYNNIVSINHQSDTYDYINTGRRFGIGEIAPDSTLHVKDAIGTFRVESTFNPGPFGGEGVFDVVLNTNTGSLSLTTSLWNTIFSNLQGDYKFIGTGASRVLIFAPGQPLHFSAGIGGGIASQIISPTTGFVGFGLPPGTASAMVHVFGTTNDSSAFALKIANNAATTLFSVRNDGRGAFPGLQVGNVGLASGDLYVDTAANILANGDLIVARKV